MKDKLERWQELCAQAAGEQDVGKLMELTREINRLLLEKEERLRRERRKTGEQGIIEAEDTGA